MLTGDQIEEWNSQPEGNEEDIHDQVLVVFKNPEDGKEVETTIINLIESGTPCNVEGYDYEYVRTIRRPE